MTLSVNNAETYAKNTQDNSASGEGKVSPCWAFLLRWEPPRVCGNDVTYGYMYVGNLDEFGYPWLPCLWPNGVSPVNLPESSLRQKDQRSNNCSNHRGSGRVGQRRTTSRASGCNTGHSGAETHYVSYFIQDDAIKRCPHAHRTLPNAVSCIGDATGFIRAVNDGKERQLNPAERESIRHISNVSCDEFPVLFALLSRVEELSREDFLTGLLTERAFKEIVDAEIRRSRRHSRPITLVYLDLDNFKAINDGVGGHAEGDNVLRVVARTLQTSVREVDYVARLHGDEFCLLLPETSIETLPVILHKVKRSLDEAMTAMRWPVSFSIGAITTTAPGIPSEALLHEADQVMYQAKQSGKNRFEYRMLPS